MPRPPTQSGTATGSTGTTATTSPPAAPAVATSTARRSKARTTTPTPATSGRAAAAGPEPADLFDQNRLAATGIPDSGSPCRMPAHTMTGLARPVSAPEHLAIRPAGVPARRDAVPDAPLHGGAFGEALRPAFPRQSPR